jgi:hypothetical protein
MCCLFQLEDTGDGDEEEKKPGIYVPPKVAAMHYGQYVVSALMGALHMYIVSLFFLLSCEKMMTN